MNAPKCEYVSQRPPPGSAKKTKAPSGGNRLEAQSVKLHHVGTLAHRDSKGDVLPAQLGAGELVRIVGAVAAGGA